MQKIDVEDNARDYSIEITLLKVITYGLQRLFRRVGSWKCPCLQVDIGFNMDGNL